jgi:hypothetical protein
MLATTQERSAAMAHPVQVHVQAQERRSRLTTFFRVLLAIPHLIVVGLWGILTAVLTIIAWFAILFTGQYPAGMWTLSTAWLTYNARVQGYVFLLTDPFPPFNGTSYYPLMASVARQPSLSRLKTFFRGILIIPFYIVVYLFGIAAQVVAFILWLVIVVTGRAPEGMTGFVEMYVRYYTRFTAFMLLVTDAWPSFASPADEGVAPPQGFGGPSEPEAWTAPQY